MKDIRWYIEKVKSEGINGGVHRTKSYPFTEDGVILVNKSERDFNGLKGAINCCKDLGVNIPAYIDYLESDDEYWILEELAPGNEFADLVNNENGVKVIDEIPYEQIEKYIRDVYLLVKNGIGVEPRRRNIFYDKEKGFYTIDVSLISKNRDNNSLREVSSFFNMFYPVFMVNFGDNEYGNLVRTKTKLKVMSAFEKGHPTFNKYKRWIYREKIDLANMLQENGCDLTLTQSEKEGLAMYIEELINIAVNRFSNEEEMFNSLYGYIDLLSASIGYCSDFDLFDRNETDLKSYIEKSVYKRLKEMFLKDFRNEQLRDVYFRIRRKEIDPINIYDVDDINAEIEEEISELINRKGL